jgi:hypothetical protein
MSEPSKPTHTMPGGCQEENSEADNGVVNDSLGTVNPADTTGTGEENPTAQPAGESSPGDAPRHTGAHRRN